MSESDLAVVQLIAQSSRRVLLLGQSYAAAEGESEPVVQLLDPDGACRALTDWWVNSSALVEERAKQAHRASELLSVTSELCAIGGVRWTYVVTSAIDDFVRRVFEQPGQRPTHEWFQCGASSAGVLDIYRLFGSVARDLYEQLPPTTLGQLAPRRARAAALLNSLREWVGPRGTLVIDGWRPDLGDWLRVRDLAAALNSALLGEGQVVICGASSSMIDHLRADEDFVRLLDSKTVRTVSARLADLIQTNDSLRAEIKDRATTAGDEIAEFRSNGLGNAIEFDTSSACNVHFTRESLLQYDATFRLLSQRSITDDSEHSSSALRAKCHLFLTEGASTHLQHARRFTYRPPQYATKLQNKVLTILSSPSPQERTVVVRGQSGCGKSVLLALLAVELREAGVPVMLATRGFAAPNRVHVDDIAQRIESAGSRCPCVLIWDALRDDEDYLDLSRYFASRGRKILVIGTTYTRPPIAQENTARKRKSTLVEINLGIALTSSDRANLLTHFETFLPREIESLRALQLQLDTDNLFVLLFRLFDGIRPQMASGLLSETASGFEDMLKAAAAGARELIGRGDLALALREALGQALGQQVEAATVEGVTPDEAKRFHDPVYAFVGAIMISSRAGLSLPVDLGLRLLGDDGVRLYRRIMGSTSFIVEDADERCVFLRARHRLEAIIWCRKHASSPEQLFKVIERIATSLQAREVTDPNSHLEDGHANFVVKLLQAHGPQGPTDLRNEASYKRIDVVVSALRDRFGDNIHPRLLQVQANAIREGVKQDQKDAPTASESTLRERINCLGRADQALALASSQAWATAGENPRGASRVFLAVTWAERAAVTGTILRTTSALTALSKDSGPATMSEYQRLYSQAQKYWRSSLALTDRNIPAIDIACWVSEHFVGLVGPEMAIESGALSEWGEATDMYAEAAETPENLASSDDRERKYWAYLGDSERVQAVLECLSSRNSAAGHALRARLLEHDESLVDGSQQALDYLDGHCSESIHEDRHLLAVYYRVWWKAHTGHSTFFPEDRLVLNLSKDDWQRFANLADTRVECDPSGPNQMARFHGAWARLELGDVDTAMRKFHSLAASSDGAVRRARSLALLSDGRGEQQKFRGEIRSISPQGRGRVWVSDLREELPFNLSEFGDVNHRIGAPLGPFVVALNYRGAFAQPIRS